MTGIEFVVGYLVAWAVRKARRVGHRADAEVDQALDTGMDRLHNLIADKLGPDPALTQLETEAAAGATTPRTEQRVRLAVEDAGEKDPEFAARLDALVAEIRQAETARGGGRRRGGSRGRGRRERRHPRRARVRRGVHHGLGDHRR